MKYRFNQGIPSWEIADIRRRFDHYPDAFMVQVTKHSERSWVFWFTFGQDNYPIICKDVEGFEELINTVDRQFQRFISVLQQTYPKMEPVEDGVLSLEQFIKMRLEDERKTGRSESEIEERFMKGLIPGLDFVTEGGDFDLV